MVRPKWFKIARNHGCETPGHVISIGVHAHEVDDPEAHKPVCGALTLDCICAVSDRWCKGKWYGHAEIACRDGETLWAWIRKQIKPGKPAWIFTLDWHANSILTGWWQELDSERFKLKLPPRQVKGKNGKLRTVKGWEGFLALERRPFVVFGVCPTGTVKLVDVNNYFDSSLVELAESIGVESPRSPASVDDSAGGRLYAERAARIVHQTMTRTIDAWRREDRGNWQPTAGRLAWSNFRHEFMDTTGIEIDNDKMDREFHRSAYYGGESTCFARGFHNGPFTKVDATAMYPARMRVGRFPRKVNQHHDSRSMVGRTRPLHPEECIANVRVECTGQVPVRSESGRVYYPAGVFCTTLAGEELARADKEGRIREWYGWTWFDCGPIFDRFIAYWQTLREQAKATQDKATGELAKLISNSLSGRFGMMTPSWTLDNRWQPPVRWGQYLAPNPDTGLWTKWRAVAGAVQREGPRTEKDDTFPAISAFITASGREYMRAVRAILPARSCLVQQTDSLILTEAGFDALQQSEFWGPGQLGKFREVDMFYYINIRTPNQYTHDHGECLAGCPTDKAQTGENRWEAKRTMTAADYIASGAVGQSVQQIRCEYIVNPEWTGRKFDSHGWLEEHMSVRGLVGDLEPAPF